MSKHPTEFTYTVDWRCVHCAARGTVSVSTNESCVRLYASVVVQHEEYSPECHRSRGTGGLAIQPPPAPAQGNDTP
jgi:hypothetical protein